MHFFDCSNLSTISFPKMTRLGGYVFNNTSIKEIIFPETLQKIGTSCCFQMYRVTITSITPPKMATNQPQFSSQNVISPL